MSLDKGIIKKICGGIIAFLVCTNLFIWSHILQAQDGLLEVHFLDVGQGDAIFIETPRGKQILIDGGPDMSVLEELGKVMSFGDRSIDMMILTHGDKDHVGGLPAVLERYDVETVVMTEYESKSGIYEAFRGLVASEDAVVITASAGQEIDMGDGVLVRILYPDMSGVSRSLNNTSIVARLDYGDTSFLFTGDIEEDVEEYLVSLYENTKLLDVDVLKVAHHGSKTSSIEEFLEATTPKYAVIPVGKENRYGHPHETVLERVQRFTDHVYMTSKEDRRVVMVGTDTKLIVE